MNHFTLSWVVTPEKNPFVFCLPAVQENKLSVTKAKRAVVNNHCLLCLSPLYRFAFFILLILFFILSSSSVSCCLCQYKYFSPSKLLSTSYLAHFDWGQDQDQVHFRSPKKASSNFNMHHFSRHKWCHAIAPAERQALLEDRKQN